jgi:hypothetical protein
MRGSEDVCTGPSESMLSKAGGLRTGSAGGDVDRGVDCSYMGVAIETI